MSKVPDWWIVKCHRCGGATDPSNRIENPDWGLLCGMCKPEDYVFDAGFDSRVYERVYDLSPITPCPTCHIALPLTGVCDFC